MDFESNFSAAIFGILLFHAVALGYAVTRCPLRVYFDKEVYNRIKKIKFELSFLNF